jgi:hypothetical protein
MKFDKSYFKELLNEAPLNLGKVHLPPQKTVMAINRKLKANAPEILKDYRRLLKDLQSSFAIGKEIVYIRDEPEESYRKKTGFGNAHRVVLRDRTKSPLGKEVVYHKGSMETTYDTVLAFTEEYIPEAKMGVVARNVKKGTPPYTIVAIVKNKVVKQETTKVSTAVPAFVRELQKEFPNAKISVEDKGGRVVHSESIEIEEGTASRSRRAASKISTDTINQAADKNRKQKPIPLSVKKRVADDLARQKKFRQKNRQQQQEEEEIVSEAAKAKEILAILKKFPAEAKKVKAGGQLSDKENLRLFDVLDAYFNKKEPRRYAHFNMKGGDAYGYIEDAIDDVYSGDFVSYESYNVEEGGMDGRDVRGGKWVNDKYVMSKKDYSKARADVKSKIKGKPYIMTMDPKSGATILTPVVLEEVQGNRPAQAKDPYTVKYSYTKKGRIMHSVLANKKDAEKFLKNVKGLGMNGIIVKGEWYANKYTKEEVEDIDEIEFNRAYKGKKPDKAAVKADLTRRMIKMGKKKKNMGKKKGKSEELEPAAEEKKQTIVVKLNTKKKIGYTITSPGKDGKPGKILKRRDVPGKSDVGEQYHDGDRPSIELIKEHFKNNDTTDKGN